MLRCTTLDYFRRLMLSRSVYWDRGRLNVMSAPSLSGESCEALRSRQHSIRRWHRGVALTFGYGGVANANACFECSRQTNSISVVARSPSLTFGIHTLI
jgi:hypothetical protein